MKLLLKILSNKKTNQIPIWLMRQAGRYIPEYKKLRANFSNFLDFCLTPEAALEVTMLPIKKFDLDAAIIFSDILIVPLALGIKVEFIESVGPVLETVRNKEDIKKIINSEVLNTFNPVFKLVELAKKKLDQNHKNITLIGFAGAPWTISCYMVEGKGSKDFLIPRAFAYQDPKTFNELVGIITEATILYLRGQIEAGAEVIKLFDSWAGVLSEEEFLKWVIKPTKRIVSELKKSYPHIPIIGFPRGAGVLSKIYALETGVDCIAVDHTIPLAWIKDSLQSHVTVQGNLDNVLLTTNKNDIEIAAKKVMSELSSKPFIFNLGHGVLPNTPIDNVEHLINVVKEYKY